MWAPVRLLGPLHLFVARRERNRKSSPFTFVGNDVDYAAFKDGLITLFGRLEFEDSYRQQLRELAQAGSESMASYAARTTDLSSYAYPNFNADVQLDFHQLPSSTLCRGCAMLRRATIFGVNANDAA